MKIAEPLIMPFLVLFDGPSKSGLTCMRIDGHPKNLRDTLINVKIN